MQQRSVEGWKRQAMHALDALLLRLPFASELLNQGTSKTLGLLAGFHLLSRTEVEGDYLEFGVFRGDSFRTAIRAAERIFRVTPARRFPGRFIAFDSFAGLPRTASMGDGTTPYREREFCASRDEFERTIARLRDRVAIEVVAGWFADTCTAQTAERLDVRRAAFVTIDCDLYESTVPVLEFVTPLLQTGTIVYFDDWFSCRGSMAHGEARAATEWLARHPSIRLVDYRNLGVTGKMFVANIG